jgi:O-antigen/teichoic acid export membrane protein
MERSNLLTTLRRLTGHSLVYGSADVVSQIVNLLLTPLYITFLTPRDFGVLAILTLFACVAKVVFRMGLEAGFFRIYYDLPNEEQRRRLAGTVALFSAGCGALLFLAIVLGAPLVVRLLFEDRTPVLAGYIVLVAADIYVGTFLFVPLSLLRIQNRPGRFASLTATRNVLNTALKVTLVVQGRGVAGVLWSDLIATTILALALTPILWRSTRAAFEAGHLRAVLAFGLPKAPHGVLVQLLNLVDRRILSRFHGLEMTGLYDKAYSLGAGVKFVLSPFETAWQPFVYSHSSQPDGPPLFARLATYIWAGFLAVGLSVAVFGRELLIVFTFTNPAFWVAAPVVPIVTLAYLFHGAFLLTSIGIGIEKRARYYPVITASAAAVNLAGNFLLIPRWGMLGAAWSTVAAYAVMALLGLWFSQRLYPIPFETGRIARLSAAALASFLLMALAPLPDLAALALAAGHSRAEFLLHVAPRALLPTIAAKLALLAVFPALVVALGVVRPEEWQRLRRGRAERRARAERNSEIGGA